MCYIPLFVVVVAVVVVVVIVIVIVVVVVVVVAVVAVAVAGTGGGVPSDALAPSDACALSVQNVNHTEAQSVGNCLNLS